MKTTINKAFYNGIAPGIFAEIINYIGIIKKSRKNKVSSHFLLLVVLNLHIYLMNDIFKII